MIENNGNPLFLINKKLAWRKNTKLDILYMPNAVIINLSCSFEKRKQV